MTRETIQRIPSQKWEVLLFAQDKCYRFSFFVTLGLPLQSWLKLFLQNKVASILL